MSSEASRPIGNWLLDALSSDVSQRLARNLEPVSFSFGEVISESGAHMDSVFFPTTSQVSLLYTMLNGATAEMGLVGNEGVVGISLFMGGDTTTNRVVVLGAGVAMKMSASAMLAEFSRGSEFQRLLLRYTQSLITQISQIALCNHFHPVKQRLSRWLLMARDRTSSDNLQMTQKLISQMLGVRREGITHDAHELQTQGFISYARGQIKIIDRRGLESCACECYAVINEERNRLLSIKEEQDLLLSLGDRRTVARRIGKDRRG